MLSRITACLLWVKNGIVDPEIDVRFRKVPQHWLGIHAIADIN